MRSNSYFVRSSGAAQKPETSIQRLGEAYSRKADEARPQAPSSPPVPFSGVQEGSTASTFLPKSIEESSPFGWSLVKGHAF